MTASSRTGFTLLELLVALAIGLVIVLAVTTTLFSLNRSYQAASRDMEQRRAVRTALDLIRREFSSVLYRPADQQLRFKVDDRDLYGKPTSTLAFTTVAPPREGEISDQIRVQYLVEEADDTSLRLTRGSRDFFQQHDLPLKNYTVLDGLEGFLVECHDGSKWLRSWDTELTSRLPARVRITLSLRDRDKTVAYQIIATPRINGQ